MPSARSCLVLAVVVAAVAPTTAACASEPDAQTAASSGVRLQSVGTFQQPLFVTAPRGDRSRIYVVEQGGRVIVVRNGRKASQPFLDISSKVTNAGEQGFLGMAFAPDFASSRRFYVYYTDRSGDQRVVEYRASSSDRANASSARLVLRMEDSEGNHNGGMLAFGPDRLLYIGTGDGGGGGDQHGPRGNAQNLDSLLGKILRIDPRRSGSRAYSIPSSNPFVGRDGARGEIYAYGLRNPWRFSFDRSTGDLSIADVGQQAVEEVNFARRGRARGVNYGWRPWEGRARYANEVAQDAVFPVLTKTRNTGFCSITGGYVVRDPSVPALRGRYVYGDYCEGSVWVATLRPGEAQGDRKLGVARVGAISSFGEDAAGRVYVTSLEGRVYRLVAS